MSQLLFMHVEGIDGEEPLGSGDKLIRLAGFKHSLGAQIGMARASAGKNSMQRRSYCQHGLFVVDKILDMTTPKLLDACTSSVSIPNVAVYVCSSIEKSSMGATGSTSSYQPSPFYTILLQDVVIDDYTYSCHGEWPVETIAFLYATISWKLNWVNRTDGTAMPLSPVGWDGTTNKAQSTDIPSSVQFSSGSGL